MAGLYQYDNGVIAQRGKCIKKTLCRLLTAVLLAGAASTVLATDAEAVFQNLNFAIPSEWVAEARSVSPSPEATPPIAAGAALSFLDQALALEEAEDWKGLLTHCKQWIQAEPENAAAWYDLGYAYDKLGRYKGAIAAWREALRINPEPLPGITWALLTPTLAAMAMRLPLFMKRCRSRYWRAR